MAKMVEDCGGIKPIMLTKKELDKAACKAKKNQESAKKTASTGNK